MASRDLDFKVFDADNHMYETQEALTKHLPTAARGAVDYLFDGRGRAKLVVKGQISQMIPNPTFERVARPGSAEDYFMGRNPEGKTFREFIGESMECIPAYREPAPRLELMDEQGVDQTLMFPTLASLIEVRTLRHARDHPADRREGDRGARVGRLQGCHDGARAAGTRAGGDGRHPIDGPAGVRPVLEARRGTWHPGVDARIRQRVPAAPLRVGGR
jgi:hypothetical protein